MLSLEVAPLGSSGAPHNAALQQTRSALASIAAALSAERRCWTDKAEHRRLGNGSTELGFEPARGLAVAGDSGSNNGVVTNGVSGEFRERAIGTFSATETELE